MKIILLSAKEHSGVRSLEIGTRGVCLLLLTLMLVPASLLLGGGVLVRHHDAGLVPYKVLATWEQELRGQREQIEQSRTASKRELEALMVRVAQLQAGLVRLDALGQRITRVARLDNSEFNFGMLPAVGGPDSGSGESYGAPKFVDVLDQLGIHLNDRQQQLEILGTLLVNRQLRSELEVAGRPVLKGWMTSLFGHRTDPFKGHRAWHNGVDFAGQLGSAVVAVASGVVTWASERQGYGLIVEVNHGGGYVTRYAHNQSNLVDVGDVVKKGQVIASMGSSGRSTGPHVHFEVYKNGKSVDPASYVDRPQRT